MTLNRFSRPSLYLTRRIRGDCLRLSISTQWLPDTWVWLDVQGEIGLRWAKAVSLTSLTLPTTSSLCLRSPRLLAAIVCDFAFHQNKYQVSRQFIYRNLFMLPTSNNALIKVILLKLCVALLLLCPYKPHFYLFHTLSLSLTVKQLEKVLQQGDISDVGDIYCSKDDKVGKRFRL